MRPIFTNTFKLGLVGAAATVAFVGILFTFESPPVETVQVGYRGTGMDLIYNSKRVAAQIPLNQPPPVIDPVEAEGELASVAYQNVQVLGDLRETEFLRLMQAITEWVSPEQGCAYCHAEGEELSSDSLYTKVVSRRMLQMTRHINADWEPHVGQTGVTCYTCHRGNPVPQGIWFAEPGQRDARGSLGNPAGQNQPAVQAGLSSLPVDPFTPFLLAGNSSEQVRVIGDTALPTGNRHSIKQTEWTYGLMFHFSESLGVSCNYCHNTRIFSSWEQSPPTRMTAWHGLQMVKDLNVAYLDPLQPVYPAERLGKTGDAPKVNCNTCHLGAYKPLYGAQMLETHPELDRNPPEAAAVPTPGPMRTQ